MERGIVLVVDVHKEFIVMIQRAVRPYNVKAVRGGRRQRVVRYLPRSVAKADGLLRRRQNGPLELADPGSCNVVALDRHHVVVHRNGYRYGVGVRRKRKFATNLRVENKCLIVMVKRRFDV